ncbi:PREDICTED: uncharacterized protein LOC108558160 isoform X2 [Nicrophorus vespilloides]|uniref:Uncharacterized protein LOC108558160 isoform X2 n=1 Tax=Nicrophorus vespilloides TaxID=110193 RepID=A0ABM1M7C4_NICVS|nr:PREDICTED: uncharacterized protein LOC108558160 isoform X2 [Nicrophorus vespilloides]
MEQIALLLSSTGLSADDLIKKLSEYKNLQANDPRKPAETNGSTYELQDEDKETEETEVQTEIVGLNYKVCDDSEEVRSDDVPPVAEKRMVREISIEEEVIELDDRVMESGKKNITIHMALDDEMCVDSPKLGEDYSSSDSKENSSNSSNLLERLVCMDDEERSSSTIIIDDDSQNDDSNSNSTFDNAKTTESDVTIERKESDNIEENTKTDNSVPSGDMRQQILNQLQQLRMKKDPLVDIAAYPVSNFYEQRMPKKSEDDSIANNSTSIGQVSSGSKKVDVISRDSPTMSNHQVLNDSLASRMISLTKTKDYKQIKGWRRKKIIFDAPPLDDKPPVLIKEEPIKSRSPSPTASCSYDVDKNLEDPQPSCSYETDTSQPPQIANVFASNNLDGFLDQQKDLKISYNVPNLKSSNRDSINLLDDTVINIPRLEVESKKKKTEVKSAEEQPQQKKEINGFKPRTLAEKRKLLETGELEKKSKKLKNQQQVSAPTPAPPPPPDDSGLIYSTIYYRGKKYRVPTKYKKNVYLNNERSKKMYKYVPIRKYKKPKVDSLVAMKTEDRVKLEEMPKKKPSIYAKTEVKPQLKYRPGPLSKKASLVVGQSKDWKPIVKELPQVVLHVTPEFGKEVHPRARQFINYDNSSEITPERLEFALTALRCPPRQKEPKTYKFKVPYEHNQKYILLQEPIAKTEKEAAEETPENATDQGELNSVVESVVADLLNCVEIKEIESSIIQEDPDRVEVLTDSTNNAGSSNKVSKRTQFFKKATKRTSSELKRLNVKFIEVNIEEKDEKPVDCPNEYCKLGCVCRSLSSVAIPSDHCGESKCMFECTCKFKKNHTNSLKVLVPPGTDILSDTTVSRLQNEAKKNLARVEKEFTQTVIQAYNQTIVVGDNIDRKKRSLKVPKKYKDYLELSELDFERESNDKKATKRCDVRMCCLEVPQIIPYCLEHYLYDCHCKGEAEYTKAKPILEPFDALLNLDSNDRDEEMLQDRIQSTKEQKTVAEKIDVLSCARSKGISTDYYAVRNRTKVFKKKLIKKLMLVPEEIPDGVMLGAWVEVTDKCERTSVKTQSEGVMTLFEPLSKLKSRRKQNLKTREQLAQDFAIQRRKRAKVLHSSAPNKRSVGLYKPSSLINAKFAKLMGENPEKSEFMLFVWSSLLNKFEENLIQIWYATPVSNKVKYIITEPTKRPINGFENIRVFESRPADTPIKLDLVKWIYEKEAPGGKNPDDVLVILKTANLYWEICGICAKNSKKEENLVVVDVDVDSLCDNSKSIAINVDSQQQASSPPPPPPLPPSTSTISSSRQEEPKVIFSHGIFQSRYLLPCKWTSREQMGYIACLPNVQDVCKWYVLQTNTKFQLLTFARNNYRIKSSDIQAVLKLSKQSNKTVIIDTDSMSFSDSHKEFGIYIDPKYSSVLFIGPYMFYEKLDVYKVNSNANNELITDSLDSEDGCWYHQVRRTQYNHQLSQRHMINASKHIQEILPKPSMSPHKFTKLLTISPKQQQPSKPILSDFIDLTQDQLPLLASPTPQMPTCSPRSILKTNVLKVNICDEKVAQTIEESASKQSPKTEKTSTTKSPQSPAPKLSKIVMPLLKPTMRSKSTAMSSLPVPTPKLTKVNCSPQSSARPVPQIIAIQKSLPKLAPKISSTTLKPLPTLAPKPIASTSTTQPIPTPTLTLMPQIVRIPKPPTNAAIEEPKSAAAVSASPELHIDLHSLYETRLKYLMKTNHLMLPNDAEPVAFQVNFNDGLLHGYKLDNMQYVYWPGEKISRRCFKNINNAIQWMKTEIKASFIMVPESFEIVVNLVESQNYMTALGRQTINAKYFSHLCIVGLFGILKMNDVANYLFDNPNLNQNSELISSLESNDLCDPVFKQTMIEMLEACELHYMDLLNRCMLQLRSHIASESTKCRELADVKERLRNRRNELMKKRNILEIGQSRQQTLPQNPLACDEVICLDSDDETGEEPQQENNASSEVITIDTSESGGGKIVLIKLDERKDALKRPASAPVIPVPKRPASVPLVPASSPALPASGPARNKRRSRELSAGVQAKRPRAATSAAAAANATGENSAGIEQIDLSYISFSEVRSFLGANGDGSAMQVTQNQLRQLKALSVKKPRSLADLTSRSDC